MNPPPSRVLCIEPYRKPPHFSVILPPMGAEYIASTIKPLVEHVEVVDTRFEDDLSSVLTDKDLVLASLSWSHRAEDAYAVLNALPRDLPTIVGGHHATTYPQAVLDHCPGVDVVVRGEGEDAIREILAGRDLRDVAGASFRENGRVIHNPPRPISSYQDPEPIDRTLRRRSYPYGLFFGGRPAGFRVESMETSRGCPFRCKFCSAATRGRKWVCRDPKSVVDEIERIEADLIFIVDDNFAHDLDRLEEMCDLLLRRRIRRHYMIQARTSIASRPELLPKLYEAGFRVMLIGVESAQDRTLKAISKGITIADVKEAFGRLSRFNWLLNGNFIVGNLDETRHEMLQMADLAHEARMDLVMLTMLRCEPDTPLADLIEERPDYHIGEEQQVYSDALSLADLRRIKREIRRRFYVPRQAARILWKVARSGLMRGRVLRGLAAHLRNRWGDAWTAPESPPAASATGGI